MPVYIKVINNMLHIIRIQIDSNKPKKYEFCDKLISYIEKIF